MIRVTGQLFSLTLMLTVACKHEHSNYCEDVPDTHNCLDKVDADTSCSSNAQCSGTTPVCDVNGSKMCVQCTTQDVSACGAATPVCGADYTCQACTEHSQCASGACLPDGTCGNDTNVAFVDPGGSDNDACTSSMPCTKVAKALATNRPFVLFAGTTDEAVTVDGGQSVTFLAKPDAVLTRSTGTGAIVTVADDNTKLTVFDLSISNAPNNVSGFGVVVPTASGSPSVELIGAKIENNPGGGISASGGTLTVWQSTISGNSGGGISASGTSLTVSQSTISGNTGGGISVSNGSFKVVGNVFFANGSGTGSVGGISITASQNASNRLDFNSFNKNQAQDGIGSAIDCTAGTFTARNNIMSGNGTLTNNEQVGGTCNHAYSIVRPGALPSGPGNTAADPMFVNTTTGDLHIQSGSPARGAADPSSDLTGLAAHDIDGDARTAPSDIGADEIP